MLDADLEKAESKLNEFKSAQDEGESSKQTNEGLLRKIQLLEEELDNAEKNARETVEKCVVVFGSGAVPTARRAGVVIRDR